MKVAIAAEARMQDDPSRIPKIMTNSNKPLSIAVPISGTAVALADFAALILMVRGSPAIHLLIIMLLAEVVLIALSIRQWVMYFRGYIAQQIDERLLDAGNGAVGISK